MAAHWTKTHAGEYTSGPYTVQKVNYGYGTEWVLLVDEGGSYPEWCNTFRTLREAKQAAASLK